MALPKNPTPKDLAVALEALDARLAAVEATVEKNIQAVRVILTVIHPDPSHDPPADPALAWAHDLLMHWIEAFGGRVDDHDT